MKRSAFAALCGIGKSMVSKYESQGLVVVVNNEVDVAETLMLLEGRLDEGKRLQALAISNNQPVPLGARTPSSAKSVTSARAQKDEVELEIKRLELALKAGDVVYVADVAEKAAEAVQAMRGAFDNIRKEAASDLCAKFDIPSDNVGAVSRFLKEKFEVALGRFAKVAAEMASKDSLPAPAEDAAA